MKLQLEQHGVDEKFSRPTMEKAAVACAAIETFYDELYKNAREREQRRQTMETKMEQKALPPDDKERWRRQLQAQETEYMRMRRLRMTSRAFEKVVTIGKGAFGKVMLVRMRGSNQLYAMKKLRKDEMLKKDQVKHVRAEREVRLVGEMGFVFALARFSDWISRFWPTAMPCTKTRILGSRVCFSRFRTRTICI